jgi:tRNA(fMet)-specific endonuclease VapC
MIYVLDTDHMSLLERAEGGAGARLRDRLRQIAPEQRGTTIISFEEQMRGWMAFLSKARQVAKQIEAYRRLHRQLDSYGQMVVLDFNEAAAIQFQRLSGARLRIGTMDLKIAAIVLAHEATLLSRNMQDFRQIEGLKVEDWTQEAPRPQSEGAP